MFSLNISSDEPLFGTAFHSLRIINAYSTNTVDHRVHSVSPEVLFPDLGFPLLALGDLNIHYPLSHPLRHFSHREISSSTPYFEKAAESGFALLNPPGEYTRFPLVGNARPSVIDLAFANPPFLPLVKSWEASLPSTGSDHIPITITLATPSPHRKPARRRWADTDWETLDPIVKGFRVPAAPPCPTPPATGRMDVRISEPSGGSLKRGHASIQAVPSLQTLVDPSPAYPPSGVSQGRQSSQETRHPTHAVSCRHLQGGVLQGDQGR